MARMIPVDEVLAVIPHFDTFCSVTKLHELVERLGRDPRFTVRQAGKSVNGAPIHHVRFGAGAVKALVVGGPHAMEPIGSLTVYSLLSLLLDAAPALTGADVEWHVVPCIDPDGALLNEGWTQRKFSLESYVQGYFAQPRKRQVDFTFPISHGKLVFDRPSAEAQVLKDIIDTVLPDFFFSLHNLGFLGGAWCGVTRGIEARFGDEIRELIGRHGWLVQPQVTYSQTSFGPGIRELPTMKGYYDHLMAHGLKLHKELLGEVGATSLEYLIDVKPDSFGMVAELPLIQHPQDVSSTPTGKSLRRMKLRFDADDKYLASVILEEFDRVRGDVDSESPFYRKLMEELVSERENLHEGVSAWYAVPIRELLSSPDYARIATERDRARAIALRVYFLANSWSFVRLLKASSQTEAIERARRRMEAVFAEALEDLRNEMDFDAYEVIDCDRLARVQLGCGLIGLNSVLEQAA